MIKTLEEYKRTIEVFELDPGVGMRRGHRGHELLKTIEALREVAKDVNVVLYGDILALGTIRLKEKINDLRERAPWLLEE